jgi:hypothetical protein
MLQVEGAGASPDLALACSAASPSSLFLRNLAVPGSHVLDLLWLRLPTDREGW